MRLRSRSALQVGLLTLAGCSPSVVDQRPAEPKVIYKDVPVAVAVGCVRNRPGAVAPINAQIAADKWGAMPTGAKAEAVRAQAGDRMNYEDRLGAATSGCPDAK